MPDVYATIAEAEPDVVLTLVEAMEGRAAEPAQQEMLNAYLADVPFPQNARVLEIGCGSGPVSRNLANRPEVSEVIGVDPSPVFIEQALRLSEGIPSLTFHQADGRDLPFAEGEFDIGVIHTVLCHVPGPEKIVNEARRVLRPNGWLAVFDGDYSTTSVALSDYDPLQACARAAIANLVHDPWVVRRFPALFEEAGLSIESFRGHSYVQTLEPTYLLSLIDRGSDFLVAAGEIAGELADALRAEARRRVDSGQFYGQITYASLIARRPG